MELRVAHDVIALRRPLITAHDEVRERDLFTVELVDDDGVVGRGEAAPLESYDGVPAAAIGLALERYARAIAGLGRGADSIAVYEACRAEADTPQALAAIDLALWERRSLLEQTPIAALLSDDSLTEVDVNATIGALGRSGAATAASAAAAEGFSCVKVKVGVGDDAGRVAAVRAAAGPSMAIRLDANGAWAVDEAVRAIESLHAVGLELIEEPVHGIPALRAVRERTTARVAMDETASEPGAIGSGAADAVCLKLSRCGGISGTLAAAALVRTSGAEPYLASTLDGPLGIAAAIHCAAALRVELPCGLATLRLLELEDVLPVRDGAIAVPSRPGLLG
jgi:L-alanine-DL-glutamate epimerase-like enolase superfamily enzyme